MSNTEDVTAAKIRSLQAELGARSAEIRQLRQFAADAARLVQRRDYMQADALLRSMSRDYTPTETQILDRMKTRRASKET